PWSVKGGGAGRTCAGERGRDDPGPCRCRGGGPYGRLRIRQVSKVYSDTWFQRFDSLRKVE
ncbi:MAG: hypothetical protein ACK56I_20245, partial [bacterium]